MEIKETKQNSIDEKKTRQKRRKQDIEDIIEVKPIYKENYKKEKNKTVQNIDNNKKYIGKLLEKAFRCQTKENLNKRSISGKYTKLQKTKTEKEKLCQVNSGR